MADPQDDSFLCERCSQLDSRLLLSSTPSNPWRPWQVADVVDSATTTGCMFCCLLVSTLELVDVDEQTRNGTLYDKALFKMQNMKSKSNTVARILAPKIESVRRERGGWITFYVPEQYGDPIARIQITVTDSKNGDRQWDIRFILAPGPGMPQSPSTSGSELSPLFPRGTLFRSRSQSLTSLSTAIQGWRQHCHDTHECWKPLFQRRNPKAEYVKLTSGEIVRRDWYRQGDFGVSLRLSSQKKEPLELEQGRLNSVAMPSRCLEIVPDDSDDGQCWFWLRETAGEMGSYVILSHRWVPHTERVRTLKSNYSARVNGGSDNAPPIAPDDVTNVFQEAAQLTVRLGVKYIWIDSLCIVQDDVDDWKREAGKMAKYYESA